MSSTIDWSKAPIGTIGRGIVGECLPVWIGTDWYEHDRESGGRYFFADVGVPVTAWRRADVTNYVARPTESLAWNGEGLPPVGTICECQNDNFDWLQGTVVHVGVDRGSKLAIMQCEHEMLWGEAGEFRPIRTPEQVAAEARKSAIDEMLMDAGVTGSAFDGDPEAEVWAAALYAAGYRKVEQP